MAKMMDYDDVLAFLYGNLPMYQRDGKIAFKKDLSNTILLCNHLNNPQENFASVHIAGTNGKGSSAHTLAAIFQAAGYKTGLYTSPHLKNFTERIKVNGQEITRDAVTAFVNENLDIIQDVAPSFFEITVAMAFHYFAIEEIDIGVIEVGLGGRLDSTNVINPNACLITNIGLDHTDMLGDTLEQIAFEKAGIIKPEVPVVISETQNSIATVFKDKADSLKAPIYFADQEYQAQLKISGIGKSTVDVLKYTNVYLHDLEVSLGGAYQLKNLPGILKTAELMRKQNFTIDELAVRRGIGEVKSLTGLNGRWQILQEAPLVICDTAHNYEGISTVLEQIEKLNPKNLIIIWGMVKDKDPEKILKILPKRARYFFGEASIPRALPAESLGDHATKSGLKGAVIKNVNDAIREAKKWAGTEDLIFIGGSSFLVAEIEDL